jgi:hypothetical protein
LFTHQGILNLTAAYTLLTESVFVAYRSETPSKETVESVLIELRKSNLNRRQMEKWPEIHCQLEASSAEIETMGQETESDLLRL